MFIDIPPPYIAQVYNCDVYGGSQYNECAADQNTVTPSSTGDNNTATSTGGTADANNATSAQPPAATPAGDATTIADTTTTPASGAENSPIATVAGLSWGVLMPIILIVAVAIAALILLIKRHNRRGQLPPSSPIAPGGPTNPF